MAWKDPNEDIKKQKEDAFLALEKTTRTTKRNKDADLARKQKERDRWGWARGGLKGAGAGAGIGAMFGGPVGALIGGGIGALGGGLLGSQGSEAEGVVGDLTGAARSVAGGLSSYADPNDRLLNMLDIQSQQNLDGVENMGQWDSGSNYGADMTGFKFSGGADGLGQTGMGDPGSMTPEERRRLLGGG